MAFISQEPILFQGTLRGNLDIEGREKEEKLVAVLRKVGLWDWVQENPLGLEMVIEERGKNLSLGERQLLCMARCLLQEAPIVIMDEATSSVDPQSEEILVRATEEFFSDRTQIIIAHRLSTLQKCDRILWLQNGEIVALGPTSEVLPRFEKTNLTI
jgi:ABC-type multidrug transport system fused ATPase/permease subunit